MRKVLLLILLMFFSLSSQAAVLEAGVSVEHVPEVLFGSWRVLAELEKTNSLRTFKPKSVDFWNLSRNGENIKLDNPFSGASAEISVQTVEGNIVVFSKRLPYDNNKVLTDTVTIRLNGDKFSGINTLTLESFSLVDKHLMKTETATYHIKGEKVAGDSIVENK